MCAAAPSSFMNGWRAADAAKYQKVRRSGFAAIVMLVILVHSPIRKVTSWCRSGILTKPSIGNPAHDLVRLGLSLASAARGSDLPGVTTAVILEELVAGYQSALVTKFENYKDRSHRPKAIQKIKLAQSTRRRWRHLAEERLATIKPTIPLGKRFWALVPEEREAVEIRNVYERFHQEVEAPLSPHFGVQEQGRLSIELLDAAYWMKGCSSLGRLLLVPHCCVWVRAKDRAFAWSM